MTGFGEARGQATDGSWSARVELRAVNNRHFKLSARMSEELAAHEADLERTLRERVKRGALQATVRVERPRRPEDYRLNLVALSSYREQLERLRRYESDGPGPGWPPVDLSALLALPGVIEDVRAGVGAGEDDGDGDGDGGDASTSASARTVDRLWSEVVALVARALEEFERSRAREGAAMAEELRALGRAVCERLERIVARAPEVVLGHQRRLVDRIAALTAGPGAAIVVEPRELAREVALFADRCDISEEVVRLRAHLEQYAAMLEAADGESSGRKLEFLVQEMGREVNTIGSKANDVEISREVVEIKALLEKVRELIQNVE